MQGIDVFCIAYSHELHESVAKRPNDYPWYPATEISTVSGRMCASFRRAHESGNAGFNKDSPSIVRVCNKLGIKHTYKAMIEYFKSTVA